ncbi:hypothetical protein P10159_4611 [Citrobacter portucalensis]|nr:hypothetical protein P10159_4611 [Citrobacter portucalensis]
MYGLTPHWFTCEIDHGFILLLCPCRQAGGTLNLLRVNACHLIR